MYRFQKGNLVTDVEWDGSVVTLVLIPAEHVEYIVDNLRVGIVYPECAAGVICTADQVLFIENSLTNRKGD